MFLLWTILILLLLFLLLSFTILRFHAAEVQKRQDIFEEALWERRHRVPLFLEGLGVNGEGREKEIIQIRAKLQSGAYTLEEQVELEKKFTASLTHIFQELEVSDRPSRSHSEAGRSEPSRPLGEATSLTPSRGLATLRQKTDMQHLALQKEFSECLEKIRIAQNDYHFSLQKFLSLGSQPWFLIFRFAFEISKNKPLELI